jgi:pimeloyl-ACP methyl ester carboxylesterase
MTVVLAAAEYGAGPPVAILHGLYGSARNWAGIARRLAQDFRVIAFDLRNHGASPWAPTMDYPEMAEDLRAAMRTRGHRHYALIGHSMGGKVAMIAALTGKAEIERLAVVDIAPVAYPLGHLAYVQAMRRLDLNAVVRRSDADTALAGAIPDPVERAFLLQNLVLNDGPPRWQLNLAAIETALLALSGFPAMPPGDVYSGPALFIAGETSHYIHPDDETEIRRLFPYAQILRIAEAGHWVHAEQPEAFVNVVVPFLTG